MKLISKVALASAIGLVGVQTVNAQMPGVDKINTPHLVAQVATVVPIQAASMKLLATLYNVDPKSINTEIVNAAANAATVKATWPGKSCTLKLVKNATANEFGWVVQEHVCNS